MFRVLISLLMVAAVFALLALIAAGLHSMVLAALAGTQ